MAGKDKGGGDKDKGGGRHRGGLKKEEQEGYNPKRPIPKDKDQKKDKGK